MSILDSMSESHHDKIASLRAKLRRSKSKKRRAKIRGEIARRQKWWEDVL